MAKNFEIQLKFTTGKTAQKLIKHLNNLAKAQDKVAKTQKKFNNDAAKAAKHVQILTQREQKHVVVMKKQQKQMQILNNRIKQQNVRLATLQGKLKVATVAQNRMRISTAGLQRVVGSLRNKILLFTFAFGSAIAGIKGFVSASSQFEAVKVRLNAMFGSVERGTKAFNTFNKIAATTPFTLQDVVEGGAALKAFGADAEALIKPTADLAAFMGTTATEAASALGRAFAGGAGAADILRERGILQLVRDFKGIEDLTKLTLPNFRKALEETLLDPASGIAGSTDALSNTMVGMMSNLADSFTRFSAAMGDLMNFKGALTGLTEFFSGMSESVTKIGETELETTIRQIEDLGGNAGKYKMLMLEIKRDTMAIAAIDEGRNLDIGKAAEKANSLTRDKLIQLKLIAEEESRLLDLGVDVDAIKAEIAKKDDDAQRNMGTASIIMEGTNATERDKLKTKIAYLLLLEEDAGKTEAQLKTANETLDKAKDYNGVLVNINSLHKSNTASKEGELDATAKIVALTKEQQTLLDEGEKLRLESREELFSKHFNKVLSLAQKSLEQRKDAELSALRDTDAFRNASSEEREDMEKDTLKKFKKQQAIIFKINKANEIVKTTMSTIRAVSEIMALSAALKAEAAKTLFSNPFKSAAMSATAAGLKGLGVATGAAGAAQAGLIAGQQAPAFARGGSFITGGEQFIKVGDNSGGRERVDITPLSSPDFGDAGGGSSINVNIMGNVIGTQEFVRDNLLPEIENTIRNNLA
jgi:hypothetical protein